MHVKIIELSFLNETTIKCVSGYDKCGFNFKPVEETKGYTATNLIHQWKCKFVMCLLIVFILFITTPDFS